MHFLLSYFLFSFVRAVSVGCPGIVLLPYNQDYCQGLLMRRFASPYKLYSAHVRPKSRLPYQALVGSNGLSLESGPVSPQLRPTLLKGPPYDLPRTIPAFTEPSRSSDYWNERCVLIVSRQGAIPACHVYHANSSVVLLWKKHNTVLAATPSAHLVWDRYLTVST